jgi:hypothetical protein
MITPDNYYSVNNKGLSQSKCKDYEIDPNFFYRKHISGELEKEPKKSFEIGAAVDDILTQINTLNNYAVFESDRRTKTGKQEYQDLIDAGKTPLSRADYDKIVDLADAVVKTSAYTEISKDYVFQEIVQIPAQLGPNFDCYYGKPDAYRIKDGVCDLLDIKTTQSVNAKKYFYQAMGFGYMKQLWFYSLLLESKYPKIKSFRYWHLAVDKKEPYLVQLFSIPKHFVDEAGFEFQQTIDRLIADTTYLKYNPSFENPAIFGQFEGGISDPGEWDDEK